MTWSRGMSWMSAIMFLRYWQKQCSNLVVILFLALTNPSYLCNQISNCNAIKHFGVMMSKWFKKIEIEIFDKWLISLDHVTYCHKFHTQGRINTTYLSSLSSSRSKWSPSKTSSSSNRLKSYKYLTFTGLIIFCLE